MITYMYNTVQVAACVAGRGIVSPWCEGVETRGSVVVIIIDEYERVSVGEESLCVAVFPVLSHGIQLRRRWKGQRRGQQGRHTISTPPG